MRTILLLILLSCFCARSATIVADSVSSADVQTAIDAASDGDTVSIPAGSATWTDQVVIDGKSLHVQGGGTNATFITIGDIGGNGPALDFQTTGVGFHKLSDIHFSATFNVVSGLVGFGVTGETNAGFHAYSLVFTNLQGRALRSIGRIFGLVEYSSFFVPDDLSVQVLTVQGNGTNSWLDSGPFVGTTNMVVFENIYAWSLFQNDGLSDCYNGGRYVIRNSHIEGPLALGGHGYDSGNFQSMQAFEFYNLTANNTNTAKNRLFHIRGGSGSISNVVIGAGFNSFGHMDYYRACTNDHPALSGKPGMTGVESIDGNEDATGYPGYQQPGRVSGWYSNQVLRVISCMSSTNNGSQAFLSVATDSCDFDLNAPGAENVIIEGRDFTNALDSSWSQLIYPHPMSVSRSTYQPLRGKALMRGGVTFR